MKINVISKGYPIAKFYLLFRMWGGGDEGIMLSATSFPGLFHPLQRKITGNKALELSDGT